MHDLSDCPRVVDLVPVTSLDTHTQLAIRDIRNQPAVRAAMFTDHLIGMNEHLQWLSDLKKNKRRLVFAALDSNRTPLGVASLDHIEPIHKTADWGFYVAETARGRGLGSAIALSLIDFSFQTLGLEKLNAEVIEGNDASMQYHAKFRFADEGFRKSQIVKEGSRLGVHLLGLEKAVWLEERANIVKQAGNSFGQIEARIQWTSAQHEEELSPIDQIEAARARNNLNWMSILRIALERSPDQSRQIVAEIKKIDQEISALTQKLID